MVTNLAKRTRSIEKIKPAKLVNYIDSLINLVYHKYAQEMWPHEKCLKGVNDMSFITDFDTFYTKNNAYVAVRYFEFNPNEYDLKLIASPTDEAYKDFTEILALSNAEVVAGINGGLFDQSTVRPTYIGYIKSSNGIVKNVYDYATPGLFYKDKKLQESWQPSEFAGAEFVRNAAFYMFLRDGAIVHDGIADMNNTNDEKVKTWNRTDKYRSMIGQKADGTIVLAMAYYVGMTGEDQATYMRDNRKCINAFNLDGGDSSRMYIDGQYYKCNPSSIRKVADALVVTKKKVTPPPTPTSGMKMYLTGSAARIRNDVQGTVLTTVANGGNIEIQDFYDWKAGDGYRWCWGTGNGVTGAFQYDPAVMHPVGTSNRGLLFMKLTGSAARIRKTVQGTVLTTVPNGNEILITEFLSNKASDGYYWCKGQYGSTVGYFQYDPEVMFPHGNV